jgi:hypothetical protein
MKYTESIPTDNRIQAHLVPFFPHRLKTSTAGDGISWKIKGDESARTGTITSRSALVGQDPIQLRHPTQFSLSTITGLFRRSGGHSDRGNSASKGQ